MAGRENEFGGGQDVDASSGASVGEGQAVDDTGACGEGEGGVSEAAGDVLAEAGRVAKRPTSPSQGRMSYEDFMAWKEEHQDKADAAEERRRTKSEIEFEAKRQEWAEAGLTPEEIRLKETQELLNRLMIGIGYARTSRTARIAQTWDKLVRLEAELRGVVLAGREPTSAKRLEEMAKGVLAKTLDRVDEETRKKVYEAMSKVAEEEEKASKQGETKGDE